MFLKTVALCLLVIFTRVLYFFMIQGTHTDPLYCLKANNLKDISQYLIFAGMVSLLTTGTKNRKLLIIVRVMYAYCFSFAIIMLYPFSPMDWLPYSEAVANLFNILWAFMFAALFLYVLFGKNYNFNKK